MSTTGGILLPLLLLLLSINARECAAAVKNGPLKILVYTPSISWSHNQFLGKIADTLQEAGHEVHFLKFISAPYLANKNETTNVHKVHLAHPANGDHDEVDVQKVSHIADAFTGKRPILHSLDHAWHTFLPLEALVCKQVAGNRKLMERLAAERFDVGITELYDLCPMAILHRIGVRTKMVASAVPLYQMGARHFGIPTFSSFVPNHFGTAMDGPRFTFLGRLLNFYADFYDWAVIDKFNVQCQEPLLQSIFGPNFPRLENIARNASLYFVNSNPAFELPRPISNKIVHIGGLVNSPDDKKPVLDKRSQHILDNAPRGVILVSFGSLADTNTMPTQMRHSILRAFARFPDFHFIWKLDKGSQRNDSARLAAVPNVHPFDWVQQTALLAHPKLRLFITHCGWNSISEAARAGVPVLGVPLFADQPFNLLVAKHRGMGLHLDVKELNGPEAVEILTKALEKMLHNPQFQKNAGDVQRKLALSPVSGRDNLIRWVEYAANFADLNELNLPVEEELGWFVYYSLDVIGFTIAILLAASLLALWTIGRMARMWRRRNGQDGEGITKKMKKKQ